MVDWAFEHDDDGLWRWIHVEKNGVTRSRKRFADVWQCVEDARKHGLEGPTRQERAPALLH